MRFATLLLIFPLALQAQLNTTLSPKTAEAFDSYVKQAEAKFTNAAHYAQLQAGDVRVDPAHDEGSTYVKDGIIHDWVGAMLVPGVTVDQALAMLQNYPSYKTWYQPEILDSRVIARNGDEWRIYLKLKKTKVFTTVLNSEYNVVYRPLGGGRWIISSHSTRVAELDDDHELPLGKGRGFLWRLNSYWLIEPRANGVYMECRAISLSRDIPFGLNFAVGPIIRTLPRESLQSTMSATAKALGHPIAAAVGRENPAVAQNEIDERRQRNRP